MYQEKELWLKKMSWTLASWKRLKEKKEDKLVSVETLWKIIDVYLIYETNIKKNLKNFNEKDATTLFLLIKSYNNNDIDEYIKRLNMTYESYNKELEKEIGYI